MRRILVLTLAVLAAGLAGCGGNVTYKPLPTDGKPLAEARKSHKTKLVKSGPSPQQYDNTPPSGVKRITYTSDGKQLFAWLAVPPGKGPHPAVLYAHGGWALGAEDFEDVRPFLNAGFAVLVPSWRGENGNPGNMEMFYGEVDDAAAALDYLATVPEVDSDRLYACGHSSGATLVMLLAETSPRLKKAMACGGFPNFRETCLRSWVGPPYSETPFDWKDEVETDLRSPARHIQDLKCPLTLYYTSDDSDYLRQAKVMAADASQQGKTVTVEVLPSGDHWTAMTTAVPKAITLFQQK